MDKTRMNWVEALDERHFAQSQLVRIDRSPESLDAVAGGYAVAVSEQAFERTPKVAAVQRLGRTGSL